MLYCWTSRLNYILYNVMALLFVSGVINHATTRWGHLVGLRDSPIGIDASKINFQMNNVDQFLMDRYFKEDAMSFTFDLDVDVTPLMNWNTHTVLAAVVCEFTSDSGHPSSVTVWDQRIMRPATEHHHISLKNEHVEYYLTDVNKELKEKDIKVFFRWEHMSTIGSYYAEMIEIGSFKAPKKYVGNSKRQFSPGPPSRQVNY